MKKKKKVKKNNKKYLNSTDQEHVLSIILNNPVQSTLYMLKLHHNKNNCKKNESPTQSLLKKVGTLDMSSPK